MIELKISGNRVKLYSSIKEMPIEKYNEMQGYLMQDLGIGSTMQDVESHMRLIDSYLSVGNITSAMEERRNLQLNFYAALNKINFKSYAFGCLIYSINGDLIGCSEDDLKEAFRKLKSMPVGQLSELLDDLKKNCIPN